MTTTQVRLQHPLPLPQAHTFAHLHAHASAQMMPTVTMIITTTIIMISSLTLTFPPPCSTPSLIRRDCYQGHTRCARCQAGRDRADRLQDQEGGGHTGGGCLHGCHRPCPLHQWCGHTPPVTLFISSSHNASYHTMKCQTLTCCRLPWYRCDDATGNTHS